MAKASYQGSGFKPAHSKNQLSHGKLTTDKLSKTLKKSNGQFLKTILKHHRQTSESKEISWKDQPKASGKGFKGTHWDFNKNKSKM